MGGSKTGGFTKSAQKEKFVRNRDIQLKGSEVKKEEKIQRLMCEGICQKCREVVQWRFRYDKYKPLKNPGTCQGCHQKTINKAYRTLCDSCAGARKACASCCGDIFAVSSNPATELPSDAADVDDKMSQSDPALESGSSAQVTAASDDV